MNLDDALREIERAARTLAAEQGRIARRNARTRVLRALKAARGALDRAFPAIRPEGRKRRGPRTPIEQKRALVLAGWVEVGSFDTQVLGRCAAAGIRAKVVKIPQGKGVFIARTYLPGWAYEISKNIADDKKLVEAKKSKKVRDGLIAILNLKKST